MFNIVLMLLLHIIQIGSINLYNQNNVISGTIPLIEENPIFGTSVKMCQENYIIANNPSYNNNQGRFITWNLNDLANPISYSLEGMSNNLFFGYSLECSSENEGFIFSSSPFDNQTGAVYIYSQNSLIKELRPSLGGNDTMFGLTMSSNGPNLVISSPEDDTYGTNDGVIYLIRYQSEWNHKYILHSSNNITDNKLGYPSLSMSNTYIVASSQFDLNTPQVQIFTYYTNSWFDDGFIDAPVDSINFSQSIDTEGLFIMIGSLENAYIYIDSGIIGPNKWFLLKTIIGSTNMFSSSISYHLGQLMISNTDNIIVYNIVDGEFIHKPELVFDTSNKPKELSLASPKIPVETFFSISTDIYRYNLITTSLSFYYNINRISFTIVFSGFVILTASLGYFYRDHFKIKKKIIDIESYDMNSMRTRQSSMSVGTVGTLGTSGSAVSSVVHLDLSDLESNLSLSGPSGIKLDDYE